MNFQTIFDNLNIILGLLLLFQWDRKHASEQATKLGLLGTRRMVGRLDSPAAADIMDSLDATLATLNARSPFIEWSQRILLNIQERFKRDSISPILDKAEDGGIN